MSSETQPNQIVEVYQGPPALKSLDGNDSTSDTWTMPGEHGYYDDNGQPVPGGVGVRDAFWGDYVFPVLTPEGEIEMVPFVRGDQVNS